ncbi:MAG: glycosyltransferase family 2 protein [Oscillospiraceae bacterium]|nr:glycosyltransferase family 2 protein [Oscillospiraceae bacterium]
MSIDRNNSHIHMKKGGKEPQTKIISYNYDENIVLSVGMIVKNEARMLEGCLKGLKPLLDAVPSELVIVDTGSDDGTIEIAKRFTDKVFHFDWINDFSAARNFGLKKCTGQWFMFLDADDHFAEVADMVEFFNNHSIHKNYNTAYYITRNYNSVKYDTYFSFRAHRIARRTEDLHFAGAIHEYFVNFYNPAYYFDSYAWHYGYAFESEEKLKEKSKRNYVLLEKELLKDPDDLRTISHVIPSMVDMDDERRELIERALILADESDKPVAYTAYFNAFALYKDEGESQKALSAIDGAIKKTNTDNAVLVEAYGSKGDFLSGIGKYAEAEECFKKYFEFYDRYESGNLEKSALGYLAASYVIPDIRDAMINKFALCIYEQNRAEEALSVYDNISLSAASPKVFMGIADTVFKIGLGASSARQKIVGFYERVLKTINDEKISYFIKLLEKLFFADKDFAEYFVGVHGKFAELMRIYTKEGAGIEAFINSFEFLPEGYSVAIDLAMSSGVCLNTTISKLNFELITEHISVLARNESNLAVLALNYKDDSFYLSGIKNLLFGTLLFEAACLTAHNLQDIVRAEVYRKYVNYSIVYVSNIYNPGLLNEDDIGALPETHRFGYYMSMANKALESDNKLGYVKELKNALVSCNYANNVIRFLLDEFTANL